MHTIVAQMLCRTCGTCNDDKARYQQFEGVFGDKLLMVKGLGWLEIVGKFFVFPQSLRFSRESAGIGELNP
jgi:hypothetical protein